MRTVWIFNHYAQEPSGPGGTRHWSIAEHLRKHGWNSVIVAGSVELNTGRQRLKPGESKRLEVFGLTPFLWLRVPPHEGNGIARIYNMICYSIRAALVSPSKGVPRPDAVIGSSVHPFAALAGWIQARRHGVPFIFEVRDLWPQTLIDLGRISPNGATAVTMRALERFLYRRSSKVVALLPRAWEYIEECGTPRDRVEWIPNGVEPGADPKPPRRTGTGACTFMYFGAHGDANGLDNLLRAMKLAQQDHLCAGLRLRLVGDGPQKPSLQQLARELKLRNVVFEGPVPKSAIPALAADADAFVFNLVNAPVFKFGISSNKLFDYLCAARPILFCCNAGNNPVSEAGAGITVQPDDPEALLGGMRAIAEMPDIIRETIGRAGREWVVANHSYAILAERLANVLGAVATERTTREQGRG
jgi:glycosyltransferase involved in cell wall biosynthesis